ncbi:MAG: T9SS type A sorting domain-containing protein [Bacteroidetes bacterium]|jgi:hypothetical protein|nr:T9SS type A sorting domain-containing protein [Bacteroidota bacterium]
MFIRLLFAISALLACLSANAQAVRADIDLRDRAVVEIPLENVAPFLAFSAKWQGTQTAISARFSPDGERWGEWSAIAEDQHGDPNSATHYSQLFFAPADSRWVQVRRAHGLDDVRLHFFNPGETPTAPKIQEKDRVQTRTSTYCPCPLGDYQGRSDWCPDGTCPEDTTPAPTSVTHLIVHHSAGTNEANDWAAVVRSIWDFHVNVRGWDDIGYNWLIDPNGNLYQGRGDNIRGAHFCGNNTGTMGVCVLGDFTAIVPTGDAKDALARLLAWKSCDVDADPLGTSFHASSDLELMHISGHRDGCSTACPGDAFYPQLPDIRQAVVDRIANQCAAIAPPDNLTAEVTSDTTVLLNWEDDSDNELAFLIERSLSMDGAYDQIAEVDADVTSYEDSDILLETGYYYRVRGRTAQDTSFYSNVAFAFTSIVSTQELLHGQTVRLFPNPAQGQVYLAWEAPLPKDVEVRLSDARGRKLKQWSLNGRQLQHQIDTRPLAQGLYLLQIRSGAQQISRRLLKQ